ncbi:hypothetical protein Ddc_10207 [Ditylenchus destructor]|nr:hypothetical protein Ddc_10207 [Ditylenchus destructor]
MKSSLPVIHSNYSTLAEEVDGFLTALQAKITKIENAVERPSPTDRQKTFKVTKVEIRRLIKDHSANLAAFSAIKKEDERMEELEIAVGHGYSIFVIFTIFGSLYTILIFTSIVEETVSLRQSRLQGLSAEERENSQNSYLKKLKRQIPIFYLATLLCIIIGFGLYAAFLTAQYHVGSCPVYSFVEVHRRREMEKGRKYLVKSFTDYPTFADELKSSLDAHLATLNKSMKFPTLEMRQLGWIYDKHAIDAALKHHLELKQYHVDRTTMPREISHAPTGSLILLSVAQTKFTNLHDAIEFPSLSDRQKTLEVTKDELWELIQDHSANLAAFGAIKREDERREEFKEAVIDGWFLLVPFVFFGALYNGMIGIALHSITRPELRHLAILGTLCEEERENLQNSRMKKLKKRIPLFYLATFLCILIELGLYLTFMAGQYYVGSCPTYSFIAQTRNDKLRKRQTYLSMSFTNYTAFADELQSTLDLHIKNLNTTMQYSALESRQLSWYYEYEAIKPALLHHTGLKKYHVDRNTMPRHIRRATPRGVSYVLSAFCLFFNFMFVMYWANQEGSVWRPGQFMKYF